MNHFSELKRIAGISEPKAYVCYVLLLKPDEHGVPKYYIGSSCNFMQRLHNHRMSNELAAAWVKKWGFQELVEARYCHDRLCALSIEVGLTVAYKARYGWDNVRGAQDCNSNSSRRAIPSYWEPPEEGIAPRTFE